MWKIFCILIRNEFLLKPKGRWASREVVSYMKQSGITYRSVEIWMGLEEAQGLGCLIFFSDDAALDRFQAAGHLPTVSSLFRSALTRTGYPSDAVSHVHVSVHSDETIKRAGGYAYFK